MHNIIILINILIWTTWQDLQSYEGRFKILAPSQMTEKTSSVKTALGNIDYHTFFWQDTSMTTDNFLFLVSYCDYPINTFPKDSTDLIEEFYSETIQSSAQSVRGTLRYYNNINQQGYEGRFWRVDYDDNTTVIKAKCFLVDNRFYMIQVFSRNGKQVNNDSEKFMDSFRILN